VVSHRLGLFVADIGVNEVFDRHHVTRDDAGVPQQLLRLLVEAGATGDNSIRNGQKNNLDELDSNDLRALAYGVDKCWAAYIVLISALKVDYRVKQLAQEGEDALVLVQRLEAGEEAQELLELLPFAGVQSLLCAVPHALHGLDGDLGLDLVAVECDGGHKGDFEGLLDDELHPYVVEVRAEPVVVKVLCEVFGDLDGLVLRQLR
jgi:hypothetical protein